MSELRTFVFKDSTGKVLAIDGVSITRDDGMRIDIYARRTDGYVDVSVYTGKLAIYPRGANSAYVLEEKY